MLITGTACQPSQLRPNPENPRRVVRDEGFEDLVRSIQAQGILQPLLITADGVIVAGHRRFEAAKALKLETIPVRVIVETDHTDRDLVCLIENLLRSDLTVLEVADYIRSCQERHNLTAEEVSDMTGINKETVKRYARLSHASPRIRKLIEEDAVTLGVAYELVRCNDEEALDEIIKEPHRLTPKMVRDRLRPDETHDAAFNDPKNAEARDHLNETRATLIQRKSQVPPRSKFVVRLYDSWLADIDDYLMEMSATSAKDAVMTAWEQGYRSELNLERVTGLTRNQVRRALGELEEDGILELVKRGGETDQARGPTEKIWHKVGEPVGSDFTPVGDQLAFD